MKRNIKLNMLALCAVATGALFTSCSTESDPSLKGDATSLFGKAPKIVAYSGSHYWGQNDTEATPLGNFVNANEYGKDWDCPTNVSEDLTAEDIKAIKELLSKGVPTSNEIILPWENYWVQQVYKGEDTYHPVDKCDPKHELDGTVRGSDQMDKLGAYNPHEEMRWTQADNYQGAMYREDYEHVNNFNSGNNTTKGGTCVCGKQHEGTTLMTGMPTEGFGPDEQFSFHESWGTDHYYNNYIIVEYKGYYYVGFDYEAHKSDQNTSNHNEGYDIERDWNFTDWIVRISPAYPKGTNSDNPGGVEDQNGNTPVPDDNCPACGHPNHDGDCPQCSDGVCHPNDTPAEKPTPDAPALTDDEVEVNLTIEGENNDAKQSHLSIHVRAATDVDIFIPCPLEYLCPADDMAIVMQHLEDKMKHGGDQVGGTAGEVEGMVSHTYFKVGSTYLDFYVEFVKAGYPDSKGQVWEEDGIHVWTDNINEEVIEYLKNNYGDGITFELWNYFNDDVTFDMLKPYFDRARVKFLDKEPDAYINAYNDTESGEMYDRDCHVGIDDSQAGDYTDPVKGNHYNGSPYNDIYTNKNSGQGGN